MGLSSRAHNQYFYMRKLKLDLLKYIIQDIIFIQMYKIIQIYVIGVLFPLFFIGIYFRWNSAPLGETVKPVSLDLEALLMSKGNQVKLAYFN